MSQTLLFLAFFLAAATFCVAAALGFLLIFSKKQFGSQQKLQKAFGITLLLVAVQLMLFSYQLAMKTLIAPFVNFLAVFADFALFAYILIDAVNDSNKAGAPKTEEKIEEVKEVKEELEPEDETVVEKLENPSVDDLLFFQKVEVLMVRDMLFCEQELSRDEVASAIGTNRTYLARSIKTATGKTFSEYITDLRTSYAAKLLTTTDEPLDLIGTLSGFRSKSAYYRAFAAAYNCSPSDYRKNSVSHSLTESSVEE